jgi:hypothetical protein
MDTSDEWIQQRTGIKERRFADRNNETTTTMGAEAAKIAIKIRRYYKRRCRLHCFCYTYVLTIISLVVVFCYKELLR